MISLQGRTAVVTGARRGIGSAIVATLEEHGATVISCVRRRSAGAGEAAAPQMGRVFAGDLTDPTVRNELFATVGEVDILVNNAGGFVDALTTEQCSQEDWQRQIELNLTVPFELCRLFLPGMRRRGWGRIVNIGSVVAQAPQLGNHIAYVAAKSGLVGFTRQLAAEVAGSGVTANVINPGTIHTEHLDDYFRMNAGAAESLAAGVPVGRLGRPEEIAGVIPYLVSDLGDFVTGSVINIDGGAVHA